jgi:hypothetical protein
MSINTLNDLKYDALETQTGISGHMADMYHAWLLAGTGESDGQTDDLEFLLLEQQGYTTGTISDRWFAFLRAAGYTGTLNDMFYQFWLAGGIVVVPATVYQVDLVSTVNFDVDLASTVEFEVVI